MLRQAVRLNSLTEVALTKLDVLDTFESVKVCVAYEADGIRYTHLPYHQSTLSQGGAGLRGAARLAHGPAAATAPGDMPRAARDYVAFLSEQIGVPGPLRRGRPRAASRPSRSLQREGLRRRSGGREHALAHVLLPATADVVVTPGNPGMALARGPHASRTRHAQEIDADLFVVGPEAPLVAGLADALRAQGKAVVRARVPTARCSRVPKPS